MTTNQKVVIGSISALFVLAIVLIVFYYKGKQNELAKQQTDPEAYYNSADQAITAKDLILGGGSLLLDVFKNKAKKKETATSGNPTIWAGTPTSPVPVGAIG